MSNRTVTTVTEYEYDVDGRVIKETVTTTERDVPMPPVWGPAGIPTKRNPWPWGSGFVVTADYNDHSFNH